MIKSSTKAFTIIELLIVLAIITLISSIVYSSFSGARESASQEERRVAAKAAEQQLKAAQEFGSIESVRRLANKTQNSSEGDPDYNPNHQNLSVDDNGVATNDDGNDSTDSPGEVPGASFSMTDGLTNTNNENSLSDIVESGIIPTDAPGGFTMSDVNNSDDGGNEDSDEGIYYFSNGEVACINGYNGCNLLKCFSAQQGQSQQKNYYFKESKEIYATNKIQFKDLDHHNTEVIMVSERTYESMNQYPSKSYFFPSIMRDDNDDAFQCISNYDYDASLNASLN